MPSALRSDPFAGTVWRLVEAQHRVSTARLVDSLEEQRLLEEILEKTKPPVPEECAHLHYLLATPFRYGCYPTASRFRRRGRTPGVYYASHQPLTAAAETVWARHRFFAAAPDAALPGRAADFTAIACAVATENAIDLTQPPLNRDRAAWTDPEDYSACLDLADRARDQGAGVIEYESVRHPEPANNLAVLTCAAFAGPEPTDRQSWRILLRPNGAQVFCDFPRLDFEFRLTATRLAWA